MQLIESPAVNLEASGTRALLKIEHGRLYTSEPDVCRRQVLTYNDGPHTEIIFLIAVDS